MNLPRIVRFGVSAVVITVIALTAYGLATNPELGPVTSAARAAAPGKFVTLS